MKKNKVILLLSDDFEPNLLGGAGVMTTTFAKKYSELGYKVFVITTNQLPEKKDLEYNIGKIKVYSIYTNYNMFFRSYISLYNPTVITKMQDLLRKINPDIVHANNVHQYLSYYSLLLCKKYTSDIFLTVHDLMLIHYGKLSSRKYLENNCLKITPLDIFLSSGFKYNPLRNIIIKFIVSRSVKKIICVSNEIKNILAENNFLKERLHVVYNGIEIKKLKSNPLLKKKLNLEDKKVILYVGRISNAKGFNNLYLAYKILKKERSDIILLIIGKNFSKIEYEDVIFTGWLKHDEVQYYYNLANVVVTPSSYCDPCPLVNMEAMNAKKPVITTKFGGSKEIILDNKTGFVINPFDHDELASKIKILLDNKVLSDKFGIENSNRLKKEFSINSSIKNYLNLFFSKE